MGKDGDREDDRQQTRNAGADIGDIAQDGRERAPQRRVRHTDERQPDPEEQPEQDVGDELPDQVGADALCGVTQCLRHQAEPPHARQQEQAVAQVFMVDQHVNGKDHDDAARRQRTQDGREDLLQIARDGDRRLNHLDRRWLLRRRIFVGQRRRLRCGLLQAPPPHRR